MRLPGTLERQLQNLRSGTSTIPDLPLVIPRNLYHISARVQEFAARALRPRITGSSTRIPVSETPQSSRVT